MNGKSRFTLTTATVLMVFVFSAICTVPAFADDSVPPAPVDTPTEVSPPVDEPAPVVTAEEAAADPAPLTELLDQLPEGTDVVVTDAAGEVVPLASQDAAEAIAAKDPIWCPDGITPIANTGGCSGSYLNLGALVADVGVAFNPAKNGTIWIETGGDGSAGPIVFNGSLNPAFATWSIYSLTLQGGWTLSGKIIDSNDPSEFDQKLSVINWNGNVTLKDILVDGATSNVAAPDSALTVETTKNILLDRVTVQNGNNSNVSNEMSGAVLDNTSGVGTVSINNSNFQDNEGDGLNVFSNGIVTTNNLTANLNGGVGAFIDNRDVATILDKAVTLKGLKQFNYNGSDGLVVYSDGLVTLSNIVANNNAGAGVFVDNTTSTTKLGVTVAGTNYFNGNTGGDGLDVLTQGTITASNLNASDNGGGNGAYLDNCYDVSVDSDCDVTIAKAVTLTGVNTFNNNGLDGLDIISFGNISVSYLTASNNAAGNGAYLTNQWENNAAIPKQSIGLWTLIGYGTFNHNGADGLVGLSYSNMLLSYLTASDNGDDGVDLYTFKNVGSATVTIRGVNTFNNNTTDGLFIEADGRITLSSLNAFDNLEDGAELITDDVGMGVALAGTNTFMDNGGYGLYVDSSGAITASNLTASFNLYGSSLDSLYLNDPTKMYNVTLTGNNSFNVNGHDGLVVYTFGTILINNLTANENGLALPAQGYGAYLDNCGVNTIPDPDVCTATVAKAVTLTGSVNLSGNYQSGLYVASLGLVTLTNVSAEANGEYGTEIYNNYLPAKPQTVTFKGSNTFNGNGGNGTGFDGLWVWSYGAIALNNVTANNNSGDGVELDNYQAGSSLFAKAITLTGVNSFVGNYYNGLYFDASGSVILTRVNADGNTDSGGDVGYSGSGVLGTAHTGSITLICGHFLSNEASGYDLTALLGPVIIKGYYSYNNPTDFANGTTESITKVCALP